MVSDPKLVVPGDDRPGAQAGDPDLNLWLCTGNEPGRVKYVRRWVGAWLVADCVEVDARRWEWTARRGNRVVATGGASTAHEAAMAAMQAARASHEKSAAILRWGMVGLTVILPIGIVTFGLSFVNAALVWVSLLVAFSYLFRFLSPESPPYSAGESSKGPKELLASARLLDLRDRLVSELVVQKRSGVVNVLIGLTTSVMGLGLVAVSLASPLILDSWPKVASALAPRAALALTSQIVAYFFLLNYRHSASEVRHLHHELAKVDFRLAALALAQSEPVSKATLEILRALLTTDKEVKAGRQPPQGDTPYIVDQLLRKLVAKLG